MAFDNFWNILNLFDDSFVRMCMVENHADERTDSIAEGRRLDDEPGAFNDAVFFHDAIFLQS